MGTPEAIKSPYPSLEKERSQVKPGEYRILLGDEQPIWVIPSRFEPFNNPTYMAKPGIPFRGFYAFENNSSARVHSFLYHKLDSEGQLETVERVVIPRGIGYGEHPGHTGQPATWYMVGAQIGTFMQESGELTLIEVPELVAPKHFSLACIMDGPLGDPILANPS